MFGREGITGERDGRSIAFHSVRGGDIVQVGLRGYWPGPEEFAWARAEGLRWYRMEEVIDRGIDATTATAMMKVATITSSSEKPRCFIWGR